MIAAAFSGATLAQNNSVSKILNGPSFEELYVIGPVTYELIESETPAVHIEGGFESVTNAQVSWTKKTLTISFPNDVPVQHLSVKIYVKNLKSLYAEENAMVISPKPLNSENLVISVSDLSSAKIVNRGKTRVSNAGNVTVRSYPYNGDMKGF